MPKGITYQKNDISNADPQSITVKAQCCCCTNNLSSYLHSKLVLEIQC